MSDIDIRTQAFSWLANHVDKFGDIFSRRVLQDGFIYKGQKVPLVAPNGIFTPKIMEFPLTITSISNGPYDDRDENGFILYKYRGTDPNHRDNVGLRKTMNKNLPIIYLRGIMPNRYLAVWPAYVIGDLIEKLTFKIAFDEMNTFSQDSNRISEDPSPRRAYITSSVKRRLHQKSFRERVLSAYRSQCSLCRLKHSELLDAAHIIPDNNPESKPTVDNGISLCKIHHAAYDSYFIGISPDYKVSVRNDILSEINGPMLQHGLKDLNNIEIELPYKNEQKPNKEFLDFRYQIFLTK